jgi:hypothetical protein
MQGRFLAAIGLAVLVAAEAGCMASAPLSDPPVFDDKPPFLALSIARQPSADFAGAPSAASVRTKENQVYAGLYRFEAGNGTLDFGLDYQYTRYVYDGIDGRNRDLHRFEFPLRYRGALSGWRINGSIAPGLSTSSNVLKEFFDRISRDDLLVTARVEGRREWRSGNWVIGAAYNRAFGKPDRRHRILTERSAGCQARVPGLRFRIPHLGRAIAVRAPVSCRAPVARHDG